METEVLEINGKDYIVFSEPDNFPENSTQGTVSDTFDTLAVHMREGKVVYCPYELPLNEFFVKEAMVGDGDVFHGDPDTSDNEWVDVDLNEDDDEFAFIKAEIDNKDRGFYMADDGFVIDTYVDGHGNVSLQYLRSLGGNIIIADAHSCDTDRHNPYYSIEGLERTGFGKLSDGDYIEKYDLNPASILEGALTSKVLPFQYQLQVPFYVWYAAQELLVDYECHRKYQNGDIQSIFIAVAEAKYDDDGDLIEADNEYDTEFTCFEIETRQDFLDAVKEMVS